jgi:uncharacterized protein involved in exopolysaccharide biosynthesis
MSNQSAVRDMQKDRIGLLDLVVMLANHKKLVFGFPLGVALVAGLASFALPEAYKATTKLLPPQQSQSSAAALLSQLGGVAGLAAGIKTPNDVYIGMLKSRVVADRLIAKFDLKKVYKTESQEKARQTLEENTVIDLNKEGLITVSVEYPDRQVVAQVANAYVDELMKMTKTLAVTEASQRRLFYEQQLTDSKNKLAEAEATLKNSLDRNGVISVDNDSRSIIETIGRLRAQISTKEAALNSMAAFITPSNPAYQKAREELNGLKAEVSRLENGRPGNNEGPEVTNNKAGLENVRTLRDVKYYQMLYELLAKQYEAARLDEARDASVIQVLDPAVEPERKVKPKRVVIVLVAWLLGFLLATSWVWGKGMLNEVSSDTRRKLAALRLRA